MLAASDSEMLDPVNRARACGINLRYSEQA
jgi:hypothetical protein